MFARAAQKEQRRSKQSTRDRHGPKRECAGVLVLLMPHRACCIPFPRVAVFRREPRIGVCSRASLASAAKFSAACTRCPRVGKRGLGWACAVGKLFDPEARSRQPLGAAARATARALCPRSRLELEMARETTRWLDLQSFARALEGSPQLLHRVGQLFLRHAELTRQLVEPAWGRSLQRCPQRSRQRRSSLALRSQVSLLDLCGRQLAFVGRCSR